MKYLAFIAATLIALSACAAMTQRTAGGTTASADIRNANGQPAGTATFAEVSGAVRITVEAEACLLGMGALTVVGTERIGSRSCRARESRTTLTFEASLRAMRREEPHRVYEECQRLR
jgi:hypothetical protein